MVRVNMNQKAEVYTVRKNMDWRMATMENLLQNEKFIKGLYLGICISQQMILKAHERKEPLKINGKLFFVQDGQELLEQMLDTVCT